MSDGRIGLGHRPYVQLEHRWAVLITITITIIIILAIITEVVEANTKDLVIFSSFNADICSMWEIVTLLMELQFSIFTHVPQADPKARALPRVSVDNGRTPKEPLFSHLPTVQGSQVGRSVTERFYAFQDLGSRKWHWSSIDEQIWGVGSFGLNHLNLCSGDGKEAQPGEIFLVFLSRLILTAEVDCMDRQQWGRGDCCSPEQGRSGRSHCWQDWTGAASHWSGLLTQEWKCFHVCLCLETCWGLKKYINWKFVAIPVVKWLATLCTLSSSTKLFYLLFNTSLNLVKS